MAPVKELHLGETLIGIQEDVVFLRPVGELTPEDARYVVHLVDDVWTQYGHSFLLVDLKKAGALSAESRRVLAKYGAAKPPLAVAMYHVSLLSRGVNALLLGAAGLLGKQRQNVMQFATEGAAVNWLEAEQRRLAPKRAPSSHLGSV